MNTFSRSIAPQDPPAPEPFARWKWTLADLDRMTEAGIIPEGRNVELIDGELYALSAKGNRHEMVRSELLASMFARRPPHVKVFSELGWRPRGDVYLEPGLLLTEARATAAACPTDAVLLLIEIADTSRSYDLKVKAPIYARLGVRELWVIDADTLITTVFREPHESGYQSRIEVAAGDLLVPALIDGFSLRVADLGIEPEGA